jgi:hypothetical protein
MANECCRNLARALQRPNSPLKYDAQLSEYRLNLSTGGYSCIMYCPFCGTRLPESKRDSLFFKPSDQDLSPIAEMSKIDDLSALCERLGNPVEIVENNGFRQYRFANWKTVDLIVQQAEGKELKYLAVPKEKEPKNQG